MGYFEDQEVRRAEIRKEEEEYQIKKREAAKLMNKRIIGGVLAGVIVFGGIIGFAASSTKIQPGYVGIVYSLNGGVQPGVLTQGLKFVSPIKKVKQYSVATEQAYLSADEREGSEENDSFMIPTSDGKTVNVDLEFAYHFDAEKLPKTFTTFKGQDGDTIEATFIRAKVKSWAGEVSSNFSVLEIYGSKRSALNAAALKHFQKNFAVYGIVIDSVSFPRIGLDKDTEKAIQARINAQQALEQEKIERDKAIITAAKAQIVAKGQADAAVLAAKGASDAVVLKAEGQAKANRALNASITPILIQNKEADARLAHGWVTIQTGSAIVDTK